MKNSILDDLNNDNNLDDGDLTVKAESSDSETIVIPKLCGFCKNNPICSILPAIISINRIGIVIGIEQCPFYPKK